MPVLRREFKNSYPLLYPSVTIQLQNFNSIINDSLFKFKYKWFKFRSWWHIFQPIVHRVECPSIQNRLFALVFVITSGTFSLYTVGAAGGCKLFYVTSILASLILAFVTNIIDFVFGRQPKTPFICTWEWIFFKALRKMPKSGGNFSFCIFYCKWGSSARPLDCCDVCRCGYATLHHVVDKSKEDRMESFFLSETCKYLYLVIIILPLKPCNVSCLKEREKWSKLVWFFLLCCSLFWYPCTH